MDDKIHFEVIGIAEALKRHYYVVPPNQREYSWFKDVQVKEFITDIRNAARKPGTPYFLGTVVLTNGKVDNTYEIADGQQRLATTTILLAAIRDWYKHQGEADFLRSIESDFLFTYDRDQRDEVSKLTMNVDDNEYFKNIILTRQNSKSQVSKNIQSHKRITEAHQFLTQYIRNIELENGVKNTKEILNDLINYLTKDAKIVKLTVKDAENAFLMFETLNDRGLKTSQVDLVKNFIFKVSDTRLQEAQKSWSSMKAAVETVSDDDDVTMDFLRVACCVISGQTTQKEVMRKVQERTQSRTDSIKIMALFEELSRDYAALLNPDHNKWNDYSDEVSKSIQIINSFTVTQIHPLMLAVAKYFNKNNTAIAYKRFVAWSVRFLVMRVMGGRLDEGYAKLANKIYNKEITTADELSQEAESILIPDGEFQKAFETINVKKPNLARYYLRSLEYRKRNETNPELIPNDETKAVNLEHIMPEKPKQGWEHIQQRDIDAYLTRLGNLALIRTNKNSIIGNLPFQEKAKVYAASTLVLTSQLGEFTSWGPDEIDQRQKQLAELAVETWPLK